MPRSARLGRFPISVPDPAPMHHQGQTGSVPETGWHGSPHRLWRRLPLSDSDLVTPIACRSWPYRRSGTPLIDIENSLRGLLGNFGLKVGLVTRSSYEARIREQITGDPNLDAVIRPMLAVRRTLREQDAALHRRMMLSAKKDGVCHLLVTAPGIDQHHCRGSGRHLRGRGRCVDPRRGQATCFTRHCSLSCIP